LRLPGIAECVLAAMTATPKGATLGVRLTHPEVEAMNSIRDRRVGSVGDRVDPAVDDRTRIDDGQLVPVRCLWLTVRALLADPVA
jgi:hypothetical protein